MTNARKKKSSKTQFKFVVWFICLFAALEIIYFQIPIDYLNNTLYRLLITEPCAAIINIFSADINVLANNNFIRSRNANLQIVRGCDGSGVLFLLIAAVIAFNTSIKNKLTGLLLGSLFVYVINTIRIVFIYYIVANHNNLFVEFHSLIAPSIIIILTSFVFIAWANWSQTDVGR